MESPSLNVFRKVVKLYLPEILVVLTQPKRWNRWPVEAVCDSVSGHIYKLLEGGTNPEKLYFLLNNFSHGIQSGPKFAPPAPT